MLVYYFLTNSAVLHSTECAKKFCPNLKRYNFLNYDCRNILLTQHWSTFIQEFGNCR